MKNDNEFVVALLTVILVVVFAIGMGIRGNVREILNRLSEIERAIIP